MVELRRSTRQATNSIPSSSLGTANTNGTTGTKRKAEGSSGPKGKRGRPAKKKDNDKKQMTIEETMPDREEEEAKDDVEMKEAEADEAKDDVAELKSDAPADAPANGEEEKATGGKKANGDAEGKFQEANGDAEAKAEDAKEISRMDDTGKVEPGESKNEAPKEPKTGEPEATEAKGDGVESSPQREALTPSSILEKGLIYFFFRGRVGIDDPSSVDELARSYIVLRPLPHGAKLVDGPIADAGNNRLMALPKKVLPKSNRDRFMVFVEEAHSSIEDIKNKHLTSSDYETKTAGTRHTPAATPIAEGVYAITTTGRESHLAYILTIPSELSEVQKDIGLRERGSFVTSVKNPQYSGPANTNLPQGPEYPQEILDEFRSLRWMPLQPKLLDYKNTQFLLIGEGIGELGKAVEKQAGDEKKETPLEEMEKLEHEDEVRVEHLKGKVLPVELGFGAFTRLIDFEKGDDSVFEDLHLSSKEYSSVPTTW